MNSRIRARSRRAFLGTMTFGAAALTTRGLFAEELFQTPKQTEGPFYPNKLPLDTDNDLLIINEATSPAVGEVNLDRVRQPCARRECGHALPALLGEPAVRGDALLAEHAGIRRDRTVEDVVAARELALEEPCGELHRVGLRPVFLVAYDRTSRVSELHSNLMPASGLERQLNKRAASTAR